MAARRYFYSEFFGSHSSGWNREGVLISTVTTSTVSTVTTAALAGSVALVGVLILLALLVQKEFSSSAEGARYRTLSKALNIAIVPLLIAFILVVFARVAEILH